MGTQLPLPKKGRSPQFSAHICCGQMAAWIKMPLGMDVGLRLGQATLCYIGTQLPSPKMGRSPQFSAHVYCGQTAGSIKMPLGMEVGLSQATVLDGDRAPLPKKGAEPPLCSSCLLWPNGWMNQDATWYGGRYRPRRHCISWGPSSPLKGAQPPNFRPMFIVAKRLDGSRS